MKKDKASLPVPEGTLIHRILNQIGGLFDETLISVSPGQKIVGLKARTVEDEAPEQGPLAGILAGLKAARNETCVVVACDIPDIMPGFLASMIKKASGYDIVVPVSSEGIIEPLFAVYSKQVIPEIEEMINRRVYSILKLLGKCRTLRIPMKDSSWLRNLNTPQDYKSFLKSLGPKSS